MKKPTSPPYERRTARLNGTVSRLEAQLDHPSALALAYAREWLRSGPAATGVDPLASGAIRRALAVYVAHLNEPDTEPQAEARAVHSCCSNLTTDPEDRKAAIQRLRGRQPGQPFPSWLDVLHGFDHAEKWTAFEDSVEALVQQINREKTQHMNTKRKTTT